MHRIALVSSLCVSLLGCADQTVCPEPAPEIELAPTTEPITDESPAVEDPSVMSHEPAPREEDDPQIARLEYNTFAIAVRVGEHDGDGDDPAGFVRVEVRNARTGGDFAIERPADSSNCFIDAVEPSIDVIFSDEEYMVFDARYSCVWGETILHVHTEHLVIALEYGSDHAGILYQGSSKVRDNRRLAVSADKREFYVEARKLAVYRHTVEWCDRKSLTVVTGQAGCSESARKLELLKRVPISVGPIE